MNLQRIPKVELHRHLEGALRFSTVVELLKVKNIDLPYNKPAELKEKLLVTSPMRDLKSVLDKFWLSQSILSSEEVLERITYEAVEDALSEGIHILELRYSLSFIQKNHEDLSFEQIHGSILKGLNRAKKDFPVKTGLIGVLGRVDDPSTQKRVTDFMVETAASHVGIDLADVESGLDTKVLIPLFDKARKAGLRVTVHAGESPGTEQNVLDSIEMLGAERIGHGVQIYKFPKIIEYVKSKNVTLELCPYSNYLTNAVPSTADHPFRKLMTAGVQVTINSDDPGIFDSNIIRDYEILHKEHGFTESEFKYCNDIAAKASFIKQ